jgi:hypothetical protein
MSHVDCTDFVTEINAPVEVVFGKVQDVAAWPTWTRAITKAWARSDGAWRRGYKFTMKTMIAPAVPLPVKVLQLEQDRLIGWGASIPLVSVLHRMEFEPLGSDRCRLRNHEFVEGPLAKLVGRVVSKRIDRLDRQWAADLAACFQRA